MRIAGHDIKPEADLKGAKLRGADLTGADLRHANLRGADLRGAYLRGADLRSAILRDADMSSASLRGADLRGAKLKNTNLKGADLEGANIQGITHKEILTLQIPDGDFIYYCDGCIKIGNMTVRLASGSEHLDWYIKYHNYTQSAVDTFKKWLYTIHKNQELDEGGN